MNRQAKQKDRLKRIVLIIGVLTVIQLLFYFQPFRVCFVKGMSMSPTLLPKDLVIIKKTTSPKLPWIKGEFEFGDLIVVQSETLAPFSNDRILKRLIGLPDDKVNIYRDLAVIQHKKTKMVFPNNRALNSQSSADDLLINEETIHTNELYLCGDNWYNSNDSRSFGTIPFSAVYGKVKISIRNFKIHRYEN